jgi:predicted secreted protein
MEQVMRLRKYLAVFFWAAVASTGAFAQTSTQNNGTLVVIPAVGEVRQANDEVTINFMIEEQDKEKAAAASRVNQKMKQGIDVIKKEDPQARLKSFGYYTYAVYPEDMPRPNANSKARGPVSWRVGQYLEVKTSNLVHLPKTVAAAQRLLALNGLQFGLSAEAARKLDEKRIEAAYRNLADRISFVAKAMGRNARDAITETIDLEASGAYAREDMRASVAMAKGASPPPQVEEPSFEPGETALEMRLVAKVRFP